MREEVVIPEPDRIEVATGKIPESGVDPQKIKGFLDEDVASHADFRKRVERPM